MVAKKMTTATPGLPAIMAPYQQLTFDKVPGFANLFYLRMMPGYFRAMNPPGYVLTDDPFDPLANVLIEPCKPEHIHHLVSGPGRQYPFAEF